MKRFILLVQKSVMIECFHKTEKNVYYGTNDMLFPTLKGQTLIECDLCVIFGLF